MTLNPCPFCGSSNVSVTFGGLVDTATGANHYVQCADCSSDGPWGTGKEGAAEKWNARALPTEELTHSHKGNFLDCPECRPAKPAPRWVHVHNKDELEAFYRGVLPNIVTEAKYHGYAIGVHGSLRRDLDLIAVPWSDDHADKSDLARAIQEAACGMPQESYQWEAKPCGRIAVSFPICWTERSKEFPNETNLGHIDLSVMPSSVPSPQATQSDATVGGRTDG